MQLEVPDNYPLHPPKATFITKVFHPNVHFKTGEICLDILKTAWTPAWTLQSVCRAIIALLEDPDAARTSLMRGSTARQDLEESLEEALAELEASEPVRQSVRAGVAAARARALQGRLRIEKLRPEL